MGRGRLGLFIFSFIWLCASAADAQDTGVVSQIFERVFGDAVRLDPTTRDAVLAGERGKRHYIDKSNDGKPEEVWFVDTTKRHPEEWRPVLVRVIDEDGDLREGKEPDLDSDLYIVDWQGDGRVDVVCDYTDRDGDNDVDEMAFYFPCSKSLSATESLMVWWGDDVGDDNLLWYDIGYTYRQRECQYRTHFGGDELFNAYILGLEDPEWIPVFENPFAFYDHDHDGVTEEVIRICGRGNVIQNLRYSFDADHDATPESPRDFDVSVSAYAPDVMLLEPRLADRRMLRGIPTGPFLSYQATPEFSRHTTWAKYQLCWDENDLNMDADGVKDGVFTDTQERWEGVICKGTDSFPQIGGPSCGLLNKRYEVISAATGPFRVHFTQTDQRIHLFGATQGWLDVDYNYDQQPDMRYEYLDTNADGYVDTWRLDTNADGQFEDEWSSQGTPPRDILYTWGEVSSIMAPMMQTLPQELLHLVIRLQQALAKLGSSDPDPVMAFLEGGLDAPSLTEDARVRLINNNESLRYCLELVRDRLIIRLKSLHDSPEFWKNFGILRSGGEVNSMRVLIENMLDLHDPLPDLAGFRSQLMKPYMRPKVAWAQDWTPPNIGWESEVCGYRVYWGQFDFFGKKKPALVLNTFSTSSNYHVEQDWGMDALHVDNSCGLGGVTLYVNGIGFPVWSPDGKGEIMWTKGFVSQTEDAVTVETTALNVGPVEGRYSVHFLCTALAGRKDSPIQVTVEGGAPGDRLELGIGITRLDEETFGVDSAAGIMASWGLQDVEIGTVGLGILFDPDTFVRITDDPEQHQVVVRMTSGQPVCYRIQGDWLNGRRFPRCPVLSNWMDELRNAVSQARGK